jgi:hypothetical protein
MRTTRLIAAGIAGTILMGAASPVFALPLAQNGAAVSQSAPETATDVRWRRGWGWGVGALGLGLAAGAIASPYYGYGYGPAYGPGYYYGPPAPAYGYGPAYYGGGPAYAGPPGGDAVAYCMQTYRSYNPRTGMFRGYDGAYHPCP